MTTSQIINQTLWNELRDAIDKAYATEHETDEDSACLRDYARNISWSDALDQLLDRETKNEKQHRGSRSVNGFSPSTAARLIIMNNVVAGSKMPHMPKASAFLVLRQTAVEAEVIGWLIADYLDPNWIKAVESKDYAKLMQAA